MARAVPPAFHLVETDNAAGTLHVAETACSVPVHRTAVTVDVHHRTVPEFAPPTTATSAAT
ncbi:MAG: hypothetical protein ACRDUA_04000 [Micromonosporaceae bacterium]